MKERAVILAVGFVLLISAAATPNPIVLNVISEVQISPVDRIELHWTPESLFVGSSTPLDEFRIQTKRGNYIITQEGELGHDDYVVIDAYNTAGIWGTTGSLDLDTEDTLTIWRGDVPVGRLSWPHWVPAPPAGKSSSFFMEIFPLPDECPLSYDQFYFRYTDPTPTFGAPNDDYAGSISGRVKDPHGASIAGALIKTATFDSVCCYYRHEETHSNDNGSYSMNLYAVWHYVEASADGFAPETVRVDVVASENTSGVDLVLSPLSGIEEPSKHPAPNLFALSQNYPNPFNPQTEISYTLPVACLVTLEVYNLLGQKVAILVDGHQKAGHRIVRWDASKAPSGVYYYRLTAGEFTSTRKMVLLR